MNSLPNLISLTRIPLALLFWKAEALMRLFWILMALFTDGLDGYLARRYKWTSKSGVLLDPITDRFFVAFVVVLLFNEGKIELWQAAALFCRDFAILLFALWIGLRGLITQVKFQAIWCGKVATVFQLALLFLLTAGMVIPAPTYFIFVALGGFAFLELLFSNLSAAPKPPSPV